MADHSGSPLAPDSGPTNKGFAVNPYPHLDPKQHGPTGWLQNDKGEAVYFWATQMTGDFQMGGSFAQSQLARSFYARNLGQATLSLTGVSPSSDYYQRLAQFVHNSHRDGFTENGVNGGLLWLTMPSPKEPSRRLMKGPRATYRLRGYVSSISRGAKRFDFFPTWNFDFIITYSQPHGTGLFSSDPAVIWKLQNYTQLIEHGGLPFVTNPTKNTSATQPTGQPTNKGGPNITQSTGASYSNQFPPGWKPF